MTVIYIDGPHHLFPDRAQRDTTQTECLEDQGYSVIRFGLQLDWDSVLQQYPHVFGVANLLSVPVEAGSELTTAKLDLDLFDPMWHPLILSLTNHKGITVEAGGDVIQDGCVVGDFLAELTLNGAVLRLIDASHPAVEVVGQSLQSQGYSVLAIQPNMTDTEVLNAFGEAK
jgi:hypothetical protein